MKTIHITSLGCPKNFVDSEVMIGLLSDDGWHIVQEPEEATILLVNTCGFIQPAVEEGIDEIIDLASYKIDSPSKKLVVTGCMVQRYRDKLKAELPEIDMLVGTEGVKDIAVILKKVIQDDSPPILHMPDRFIMNSQLPRELATPPFRAWMKITEGCDNNCSYCMIPSIRGGLRSRTVDDLVVEASNLSQNGVKELTLIAQDLTAYGTENGGKASLLPLLKSLLGKTDIPWIRLLYLYPSGIVEELLHLMAENDRIVPYLDIPFQHVSDPVLKRMNRRYSSSDLVRLISRTREFLPDIALRTTFLLGFPGETEADVDQLENFLQETKIDHVGVFTYANEEGCPSEHFADQVPEEEKQRRVDHILTAQSYISNEIQQKYLGKIEPVIIEGLSSETDLLLEGRTRYQAPDIDGCVYINEGEANPGDIVSVQISDTQTYDLVGGII